MTAYPGKINPICAESPGDEVRVLPGEADDEDDRHKEDDVAHGRAGPIEASEEEEREANRADGCEAVGVTAAIACRDIPHGGADKATEEG